MKSLVVYYSRTGTTKKVAQEITKALKSDIEEVIDIKNRKGHLGYLISGRDASMKRLTLIKPMQKDASKYDLVIIGTPVWAWDVTPAIRTYLVQTKITKKAAVFCTLGGSGSKTAFKSMKALIKGEVVAELSLKTKEVKNNPSDKIKEFVEKINSN